MPEFTGLDRRGQSRHASFAVEECDKCPGGRRVVQLRFPEESDRQLRGRFRVEDDECFDRRDAQCWCVRRIGIGSEQLSCALGLEACHGAESSAPHERRQRLIPGHREKTLLRVACLPDSGQDGGIGAELEIRVLQHLRQPPGMLIRLEASGTRRPGGSRQDPRVGIGVVLAATHIAIRHQDELFDLLLAP